MENDDGRFGVADRAVAASPSSPQAVSSVPASIPSAIARFLGFGPKPAAKPEYWPRSALSLIRGLPETQAYFDADDALYSYESPFYRYCASGFPLIFADKLWRREWEAKRRRLEQDQRLAWNAACAATAQAIEARQGGDSEASSVHESAVPKGCAQRQPSIHPYHSETGEGE